MQRERQKAGWRPRPGLLVLPALILSLGLTSCVSPVDVDPGSSLATTGFGFVSGSFKREVSPAELVSNVQQTRRELAAAASPAEEARATERYNQATTELVRYLQKERPDWIEGVEIPAGTAGTVRVTPDTALFPVDPGDAFRIHIASDYKVKGFRNHYRRDGVGVPLVIERQRSQRSPLDRFVPPEGRFYPAAMVVEAGKQDSDLVLRLVSTCRTETCEVAGRERSLAADITMSYTFLLEASELQRRRFDGVFDGDKFEEREGLFLLEPYQPDKIPLLMVHGLFSSPITFYELTNEVYGDADLRKHYQVWHYVYATGRSILDSSHRLRDAVREFDTVVTDIYGRPPRSGMVVVGHSMGGILAHTLVSDSGPALWDASFTAPIDSLELERADRERLRGAFFFKARPDAKRVIFVATPHRGSDVATSIYGRLGARITKLPMESEDFARRVLAVANPSLTDGVRDLFEDNGGVSIRNLSPHNPVITTIASLEFAPGVKTHSIIGRKRGNGDEASDGIVDYWSAHLPGTASEKLVTTRMHNVHQEPEAIEEIKRILKVHLVEMRG